MVRHIRDISAGRLRLAGVCGLMTAALVQSACTAPADDSAASSGQSPDPATASVLTAWPAGRWPLAEDAALEARIDALMAQMRLEDKIGQLVQADIGSVTPDDVRRYRLGSILAGGNSDPGGRYDATPAEWLALADAFHAASLDTRDGGVAIPLLFGIDAVHGNSNVVGATLFPHNIGLGAARNAELVRRIGAITALETRAVGMDWAFAPTLAVPQDDRWGRTYEGYAEDPALVAEYAGVMVEGLQGKVGDADFLGPSRVIASAKHFVGDGGTENGKDQGDTQVTPEVLARLHGAGYPPAIAAGAQTVMASFNSVHGQKMHGHRELLTDVLRGRLDFRGFVVGDWNGHGQVAGCENTRCPTAVAAGIDMLMAPDTWKSVYETTLAAARDGSLQMSRVDEAVRRILRVKLQMGLFEAGKPSERLHGGDFALLGAPEHRAVARQAVRESLVLLKNAGGLLPLNPKTNLLVAGDAADDVGRQSGGWTLNWQGTGTRRDDYPNAQTILEALREQVQAAGGRVEYSAEGRYARKPDAAVVVFGEEPYAEFQGDLPDLRYKRGDDRDLTLLRRLRAEGIPVVAVFLSGRPLWMNREINAADAFVAAWLPGSEGGGVADVLLRRADGSVAYDFTGKLSFSWPRTAVQFRNNVGMPGYDPLFAYGHGLRYGDDGELAALPEDSGVTGEDAAPGRYLVRGRPASGHALYAGTDTAAASPGTRIDPLPWTSADGRLQVRAVDRLAQEDALKFESSAAHTLRLRAESDGDLRRESNGDIVLVLTLRVDTAAPGASLRAGMDCEQGCGPGPSVALPLTSLPRGEWTRVGIPLKCFAQAGTDLAKVRDPLTLAMSGELVFALSEVALGALDQADTLTACER